MVSDEITPLSKARQALAQATTPQASKDVEAMAAAAQAWAKEQNDFELAFEAAVVYIMARCKTTELIAPNIRPDGRPNNMDPDVHIISDYGFTHKQWQRRKAELEALQDQVDFEQYHDECIEKGVLPTPYGLRSFHYKRDMRHGNVQTIYAPQGMDACQTPAYAIDPLLPYLSRFSTIWEPAAGEGLMVDALLDSGFHVLASDLIRDQNFFFYEPDEEWDCLVTNPPYSIKFKWLERCYQLGKPFALLMPLEALGTRTAQEMFDACGIEIILLNRRVNFKMPEKGWEAGGATFPTVWYTWQLNLGSQLVFGKIEYE